MLVRWERRDSGRRAAEERREVSLAEERSLSEPLKVAVVASSRACQPVHDGSQPGTSIRI